jgi:hypothetical protein
MPGSPSVIEMVRSFVLARMAQCLLGNHELNLLRGSREPGSRWFIEPAHVEQQPCAQKYTGRATEYR